MKKRSFLGHNLAFARCAGIALGLVGAFAVFAGCTNISLDISNGSGCCGCCDNGCGGDDAVSSSVSTSAGETTGSGKTTSSGEGGAMGTGGSSDSTGSTGVGGEGGCLQLGEGCGGKPKFLNTPDINFGQVVIGTNYAQLDGNYVLSVADISTVPIQNVNYAAPSYHNAAWTRANLGHIFGLTLDSDGNIYTTVTAIYNENSLTSYTHPGTIWKIDTMTGGNTVLAKLPNKGPALGNINYACKYKMLYASNFEDGRIYRVDLVGNMIETFDHATGAITPGGLPEAGDVAGEYAPLGARPWAVQVFQDRLYYALWNEDEGRASATASNEIWSIALTPGGAFSGAPQLEITIPPRPGEIYSNPVADISFGPKGTMMLAERSMIKDGQSTAHRSRALEYSLCGGEWLPSGHNFSIGIYSLETNSAGGTDYDFSMDGRAWFTGDALHFSSMPPDYIYGYQGTPLTGGSALTSTLIDNDGDTGSGGVKTEIGDVEIPLPL